MGKHCNDEQLLRHLDSELSREEVAAVEDHLACCWQCRARQAQLEVQINEVAGVFADCEFSEAQLRRGLERLHREMPQAPRHRHVGYQV